MRKALSYIIIAIFSQSCFSLKSNNIDIIDLIVKIDFQAGFSNDSIALSIDSVLVAENILLNSFSSTGFTLVTFTIYKGINIPPFCVLQKNIGNRIVIPLKELSQDSILLGLKLNSKSDFRFIKLELQKKRYVGITKTIIYNKTVFQYMQSDHPFVYY